MFPIKAKNDLIILLTVKSDFFSRKKTKAVRRSLF